MLIGESDIRRDRHAALYLITFIFYGFTEYMMYIYNIIVQHVYTVTLCTFRCCFQQASCGATFFFQRCLRPAIWGAALSSLHCEEYATWYCSEYEDMFPSLLLGLHRPMTFSSLSPWPNFAFGPVGFGRTWLNNWIWLKPPQFQLFRVLRFLNVPEENVSSDEELYTPFERCNMSAPPVLQDSHSLRCCKDLLEMPVYNGALCCTNLSVTSLSLSLQDRTRRTYGPIVPLILGSTSEQRTSIHKSV